MLCIFNFFETDWDSQKIIAEEHSNEYCFATLEVDNGNFEENYYNLKFGDGICINAVAGCHLAICNTLGEVI